MSLSAFATLLMYTRHETRQQKTITAAETWERCIVPSQHSPEAELSVEDVTGRSNRVNSRLDDNGTSELTEERQCLWWPTVTRSNLSPQPPRRSGQSGLPFSGEK